MSWIEVGQLSSFAEGEAREIVVLDRIVAVCRVSDRVYALDGICPHQGGPLGKGQLAGCVLTCPWHGWQFDVTDGQSLLSPAVKQPTLAARVDDGRVWIELEED